MFINLLVINVGVSVGNRSVVCDVFSFVDIIFVVDPPVGALGGCVDGDVGAFVCISGLERCDVQVYIRECFVGLVDLEWVDSCGMILRVVSGGVVKRIGGIYLRSKLRRDEIVTALEPYMDCDILAGDFNARHDRWGHVADVQGHNHQGTVVAGVLGEMDFMIPSVPTHDGMSVIDLCGFPWKPVKYRISDRAGLPHSAQIVKLDVDNDRLPAPRPAYNKVRWDLVESDLKDIDPPKDDVWKKVRHIVDGLPRKRAGRGICDWWNADLERMRDDMRRLRWEVVRDRRRLHDFRLVRKIYWAAVVQARYRRMAEVLSTAKDPEIFRYVHALNTSRTLPAMDDGAGRMCRSHEDISELIAEQLDPVDKVEWVADNCDVWDLVSENVEAGLRMSPSNPGTSFDHMSYPFARFWFRKARDSFTSSMKEALCHGDEDWHRGKLF